MSDQDIIAEVIAQHYVWDALEDNKTVRCRCDVDNPSMTNGVEDGGWMPFGDYTAHVSIAVTEALKLTQKQPVPVPASEPAALGSTSTDFTEQVNMGFHAECIGGTTPLCPAGCDCSCCYGYTDKSCHHFAKPCNCGRTHE